LVCVEVRYEARRGLGADLRGIFVCVVRCVFDGTSVGC
jgi:hypothetical protein